MSREEELARNLKAFEAQLAGLTPRTDRLDRERLIFLAGRQSAVAERTRPTARVIRWAWPGAFSAMTAVAATLAVLLLRGDTGPPVPIAEKILQQQAESDPPAPDTPRTHIPPLPGPEQPSPVPKAVARESARDGGLWTFVGLPWLHNPAADLLSGDLSYPRLRDTVLAQGLESWAVRDSTQRAESSGGAVPYRQMLEDLLRDQSSDQTPRDQPAVEIPLFPGANS
jgi:hypothetical protein